MKKTIKTLLLLCLSLILCMAFLTSCNENNSTDGTTGSNQSSEQEGNITHTHSFGEWVITKEATCLADGAQERACACGEKEIEIIKAKGSHTFEEWVVTKEATCLADGAQERVCACGEKEIEVIKSKGFHTFGEWGVTKEATCLTEGAQERACACGEKEKQTLGAKGHTLGEWITVKEPTAKEDGLKEQKCTVCGEKTATETLPATGSLGLAYTVNADGKTCTITGIGTCTDAEVVIPASLNGYQVTAIAKRAFYDCKTMKEITIPATVKEIGTQIFFKADNLTTVYYNSTYYSSENPFMNIPSVKKIVFGGTMVPAYICEGMNALESVLIGNSVTSIGNYAFYGCSSLTIVEIPDSVTSIGWEAFRGCRSLTSVEIPDSITSIGSSAFRDCSGLTSVEIPDSVTSIGNSAFYGCSSLTSVEIPDSVTSIGDYAFYGCSSLTSVEIPDSVTSIGDVAFYGCSSLTSVRYAGTKAEWEAIEKGSSLFLGSGVKEIVCSDGTVSRY